MGLDDHLWSRAIDSFSRWVPMAQRGCQDKKVTSLRVQRQAHLDSNTTASQCYSKSPAIAHFSQLQLPDCQGQRKSPKVTTCLALFLASSKDLPLSTNRWTTFSHRLCTLMSRFLMSTTSCFWLKYFRWVPVLSSSIICSRWEFTSLAKTFPHTKKEHN